MPSVRITVHFLDSLQDELAEMRARTDARKRARRGIVPPVPPPLWQRVLEVRALERELEAAEAELDELERRART